MVGDESPTAKHEQQDPSFHHFYHIAKPRTKECKKENQLVEDLQLFLLFLEARLLLFFVDDSTGLGEAAPSLISFESGSCSKVFWPSKHTIRSPSWHKFNTRTKSAVIYYELSCKLNKIATATGNGVIAVHYLFFQVIYLLISKSQSSLLPGNQFRQSDVRNNDNQAPATLCLGLVVFSRFPNHVINKANVGYSVCRF